MENTPNDSYSNQITNGYDNNSNIMTSGNPEDFTFNKLREIQLLIKKESGLKELCKLIIFNSYYFCYNDC